MAEAQTLDYTYATGIERGCRDVRVRLDGEGCDLALTRDFKQTIVGRVRRDPTFAKALLDEAATLILNGEPHTACLILRDLVAAAHAASLQITNS